MNGLVIYRGPSSLDGAPIVAIATGLERASTNAKTGDTLQTWILRSDRSPIDAHRDGADASICGNCPFRKGGCYVRLDTGPLGVWKAYRHQRVASAEAIRAAGAGRVVRLGAYGDPAAVPVNVWRMLLADAAGHVGYTHQWKGRGRHLASITMASVESPEGAREARARGFRTFRVRAPGAPIMKGEIECPNTSHGVQCADCRLCFGAHPTAPSITIEAHGGPPQLRMALQRIES